MVDQANAFAAAVSAVEVVMNRYFGELDRLAWSDDQVYATYYQKVAAGLQIPGHDSWNRLREIADTILYGDRNKAQIRFAALSLDGIGVANYGDCSMILKKPMIEHRASLFEENSVVFMERHDVRGKLKFVVPVGFRCPWDQRVDLCLAKLTGELHPATAPAEFAGILLFQGAHSGEDRFVEVHIWGSLTIRSFSRVVVQQWASPPSPVELANVEAKLLQAGVEFIKP